MIKLKSLINKDILNELEFTNQASFDAYKKRHKMKPDTQVKIAGKETTAGEASKEKGLFPRLRANIFGPSKPKADMPKPLDTKHPLNQKKIFDPKRGSDITIGKALSNPEKYKHLAADIQSHIDVDPTGEKYTQKQADAAGVKQRRAERDKKRADSARVTYDRTDKETKPTDSKPKKKSSSNDTPKKDSNDNPYADMEKRFKDRYTKSSSDKSGGFGGFGGGSFGGAGAGGSW